MSGRAQSVRARVFHGRRGAVRNAFRYGVDYLMLDVDAGAPRAALTAFNRWGLWSVHEHDLGDGKSSLPEYAAKVKRAFGLEAVCDGPTRLLTQPRCLGYVFNPVSFWFFSDRSGSLRAVLAEVNNVSRDRHSYLCAHPDLRPILPADELSVRKVFHVSPFQPVDGGYRFHFRLTGSEVAIRIRYDSETDDGLLATLAGVIAPATAGRMLGSLIRFPLGAMRVIALIHMQAAVLKLKGAAFRRRPAPPSQEISR